MNFLPVTLQNTTLVKQALTIFHGFEKLFWLYTNPLNSSNTCGPAFFSCAPYIEINDRNKWIKNSSAMQNPPEAHLTFLLMVIYTIPSKAVPPQ